MTEYFQIPNPKGVTHLLIPNSDSIKNDKLTELLTNIVSTRPSIQTEDGYLFMIEQSDDLYNELIESGRLVKDYRKGLTDIAKGKDERVDKVDRRIIKEVINANDPIRVPQSLEYGDLLDIMKEKAKIKELPNGKLTDEQKKEYDEKKTHDERMKYLENIITSTK